MIKAPPNPDEMRMPANKFDEMMRHALGAPPPSEMAAKPETQEEIAKRLTAKRQQRKR